MWDVFDTNIVLTIIYFSQDFVSIARQDITRLVISHTLSIWVNIFYKKIKQEKLPFVVVFFEKIPDLDDKEFEINYSP